MEENEAPSSVNLVTNGNMATNNRGWTLMTGASYSSGTMKIVGTPSNGSAKIYQDIPINKLGSEQTYVLSGWAKGNAVPDNITTRDPATDAEAHAKDDTKQFGLRAVIYYSDGAQEFHLVSFNPDLTDWQFASLAVIPKQADKTVSKIRVTVTYGKNANVAYFDNISLVQEAAQTMKYDADGNLVSVTTPTITADTNTYSNGNLTKTVTGSDGTYTYTYGNTTYPHRITKVKKSTLVNGYDYDDYGNHHYNSYYSTSGGIAMQTWSHYTNSGNLLGRFMDINKNTTYYTYSGAFNKLYGIPSTIKDSKGNIVSQTTDTFGRLRTISVANTNVLEYIYSNFRLSEIKRTDSTSNDAYSYNLAYDAYGNMTSIKAGNTTLASYTYGGSNGQLMQQTCGNGDIVEFTYDDLGRTKTAEYDNDRTVTYTYNGEGSLHSIHDSKLGHTYLFNYDKLGRLISSRKVNASGQTQMMTHQEYNEVNQLIQQSWQYGDTSYSSGYTYNAADESVNTVTFKGKDEDEDEYTTLQTLTYGYDHLLRLSSVVAGSVYTKNYTYIDQSTKISSMEVGTLTYDLPTDKSFTYTYDAAGNIETYTAPGKSTITYTYDAQNQLTQAQSSSATYSYSYDAFGNITSANGMTYTYGNANWPDLLTAYDDETISYDGSGNPISYYNGTRWTMQWAEGRNLTKATKSGTEINYTYDHNGLRTSKGVNGVVHNYYYASGKLLRETYGSNTLDFFYDASGTPFALKYNGTLYYYITNLQGDVISIVNGSGTPVAEYEYDPYGKLLTTGLTGVGAANPLRYRGYYYDSESGFYYLNSRYYDATIGRFLNPDSFASTGQGILGHNMFAYCNNNPVIRADSEGTFWHIVGGAVLGAVAGTVTKMITNAISGQKITDGLVTAGIAGAVSGGLAASGVGLVGQVVGNALIGAGNNAADQLIGMANGTKTDGFDVGSMLLDGAIGATAGFAGGAGAGNRGLTKIGLTNVKRTWNALTHKGAKVALEVLGQGLTYFGKIAQHMVKPLVTAIAKSSGSVIINNTAKVMIA